MTAIMAMRKTYKDAFVEKHGQKLGFMSAFVKAAAIALQDQPVVNAAIDGDDIVYRDYVNIGFAAATPTGLVVPVIREVQDMDILGIEREMGRLTEKARSGKLELADLKGVCPPPHPTPRTHTGRRLLPHSAPPPRIAGPTFSITNGGVFGSLMSTPILTPPQSAILGMHGVFQRPIAKGSELVVRPMMYVALTYDHRIIDGREAVLALRRIKELIEDPNRFLLSV